MQHFKPELRIPGPTPLPPRVLQRMAEPMINHRGQAFKEKFPEIMKRLGPLFGTENPIYMITGSGTAGMETAVSNLVSPQTPVLCLVGGFFGQRWADLCRAYRADLHVLEFPWGTGADPQKVEDYLSGHPEIEIIFLVHNESSTAVLNNLKEISQARGRHRALLAVDAISSLGGTPVDMDTWGLDVVIGASQKCLMTPPGTVFISISQRARSYLEKSSSSRYYFDLKKYEQFLEKGEAPFTPNVNNVFALECALDLIEAEGLPNVFARHLLLRDMFRAGVKAVGLELLVADRDASPTVTGVKLSNADQFRARIKELYGVEFAGGQGPQAGRTFRVGHMGYATPLDVLTALAVIEMDLEKAGQATKAAETVMIGRKP
ncbi:MAG: alanine--glyoxylate aminotransferase family protein [Firmicutes bacterium]|nr:alanine--glyoxylate aminotransferase family protein [Bacillota bacterium]